MTDGFSAVPDAVVDGLHAIRRGSLFSRGAGGEETESILLALLTYVPPYAQLEDGGGSLQYASTIRHTDGQLMYSPVLMGCLYEALGDDDPVSRLKTIWAVLQAGGAEGAAMAKDLARRGVVTGDSWPLNDLLAEWANGKKNAVPGGRGAVRYAADLVAEWAVHKCPGRITLVNGRHGDTVMDEARRSGALDVSGALVRMLGDCAPQVILLLRL
jgi:hypothetical protein